MKLAAIMVLAIMPSPVFALGMEFSAMWFLTADEREIVDTLDRQSQMELCNVWKKAADNDGLAGDKARIYIGESLERRGESPFLCQQMGFGS